MSQTPECDKLANQDKEHRTLIDFMEWLQEQGIQLGKFHKHKEDCYTPHTHDKACFHGCTIKRNKICGYHEDELAGLTRKSENLIMDFLDIDLIKLDKERRDMLDQMRKVHT